MKITVFTATYNRGYIINSAYESLVRQTCKDFEWIVIDDGSTDNTQELFSKWTDLDNGFPIRYFKVENGGKMRAANKAYELAQGELFLNLDSDDFLPDDCIETIINWEATIADKKDKFAGVAGLKCHFDGSIIGTTFTGEYIDASTVDREKYGISGDRAEVFYTELLRRHPFKVFDGEKFISEGLTWVEICCEEKKVLRWFNKPLSYCEYIEDGYSAHAFELMCNNPKGIAYYVKSIIKILHPSFIKRLKLYHRYFLVAEHNNYSAKKLRADLEIGLFVYYALFIGHHLITLKRRITGGK